MASASTTSYAAAFGSKQQIPKSVEFKSAKKQIKLTPWTKISPDTQFAIKWYYKGTLRTIEYDDNTSQLIAEQWSKKNRTFYIDYKEPRHYMTRHVFDFSSNTVDRVQLGYSNPPKSNAYYADLFSRTSKDAEWKIHYIPYLEYSNRIMYNNIILWARVSENGIVSTMNKKISDTEKIPASTVVLGDIQSRYNNMGILQANSSTERNVETILKQGLMSQGDRDFVLHFIPFGSIYDLASMNWYSLSDIKYSTKPLNFETLNFNIEIYTTEQNFLVSHQAAIMNGNIYTQEGVVELISGTFDDYYPNPWRRILNQNNIMNILRVAQTRNIDMRTGGINNYNIQIIPWNSAYVINNNYGVEIEFVDIDNCYLSDPENRGTMKQFYKKKFDQILEDLVIQTWVPEPYSPWLKICHADELIEMKRNFLDYI